MSHAPLAEREWCRKNQRCADDENLYFSFIGVNLVAASDLGTSVEVNVFRTFENVEPIDGDTGFVVEDHLWELRLCGSELVFFVPGATYKEFATTS